MAVFNQQSCFQDEDIIVWIENFTFCDLKDVCRKICHFKSKKQEEREKEKHLPPRPGRIR